VFCVRDAHCTPRRRNESGGGGVVGGGGGGDSRAEEEEEEAHDDDDDNDDDDDDDDDDGDSDGDDDDEEEEEDDDDDDDDDDKEVEEGEEAEAREERTGRGQSSCRGVRSAERPIFSRPFSFLPPGATLPPCLLRLLSPSKVAACVLFIYLPVLRPASTLDRPVPLRESPAPFYSASPASSVSRACTRPFFCRILSVPPFVAALFAVARGRRKRSERAGITASAKVVRLMKSQFNVLPFADSAAGPIGLSGGARRGEECTPVRTGPKGETRIYSVVRLDAQMDRHGENSARRDRVTP